MRVISGTAKGKRLTPPDDRRVRPTSDRIKEALFSILHSMTGGIDDFSVIDLFSGTGNLGIEAISRGAGSAVFIDNHRASVAIIKANLQATGFYAKSEVILSDVFQSLAKLSDSNSKFDIVFADPPYGQGLAEKLIQHLASIDVLNERAIVVIESGAKESPVLTTGNLKQIDRRIYGDTALAFFEFY
jgi:16S rRNA (guanine(966)-N(2))-methyltransferase RsmD